MEKTCMCVCVEQCVFWNTLESFRAEEFLLRCLKTRFRAEH